MPDGRPPTAARLRRLASGLSGVRPGPEDLRAVARTLVAVEQVAGQREAWDPALEPATTFTPRGPRERPLPGVRTPLPEPPAGSLAADLAAAAAGLDPQALAAPYRERLRSGNAALRAFITPCPPEHPQGGPSTGAGPLYGAAVAVKDIIETAGLVTTGGSALRRDHVPQHDAAVWASLRRAGALCLGKTNTHEFAAGTTSANDTFGQVRNPRDISRVSGGSSGGSAAAVAAGMAPAALGTDTAGSVRIPAACCGVVGLKPTYDRVPRAGVFPLSWSLDHVGPIAASVRDVAMLLAVMAGDVPGVPGLPPGEVAGRPFADGLTGVRIGVPYAWLEEAGPTARATGGRPLTPGVRRCFERALERMRALGAEVVEVDMGSADLAAAVNRTITTAEAAAYHAPDLRTRPAAYGTTVRGRLLAGRFVSAEDYLQAQRLRAALVQRHAELLVGPGAVHAVATPTLPIPAPPVGAPPAAAMALLRFCAPFNLTGWPALTLPCGLDRSLPVGLQLAAGPWEDEWLLGLAATLEPHLRTGPA